MPLANLRIADESLLEVELNESWSGLVCRLMIDVDLKDTASDFVACRPIGLEYHPVSLGQLDAKFRYDSISFFSYDMSSQHTLFSAGQARYETLMVATFKPARGESARKTQLHLALAIWI